MTVPPTLATATVTAKDATPTRWIVFLHGILGSGANWRTFARRIVEQRPHWGALLVDLRLHGESRGFEAPHTLALAARDVVEAVSGHDVRAILGHSFGGKVAIDAARDLPLEHLIVVDATPGARPDGRGSSGVRHIVDLLTRLPQTFPDRDAFTAWAEERGVSRQTSMWLAMNVRPTEDGAFTFRLDIAAIRSMMDDYFLRDVWDVIENRDGRTRQTHLIAGGRSQVLDEADIARGRALPGVTVDVIPDAGHWVHVDAPDLLRDLVLGWL